MKDILPYLVLVGLFSGCATQPSPPPKPDPIVQMMTGLVAIAQMSQASRQAPEIRADTSVIFPSRSQAIALGLVSYRAEQGDWPITPGDLESYLTLKYKDLAPPSGDFSDLKLEESDDESIRFSLTRIGLPDENYNVTKSAIITFSLRPTNILHAADLDMKTQSTQPEFPWGELVAQLFIELPLRIALEKNER